MQTAVKFLRDEKVASSPLAKRISFLESKGLSQNEIEEALSRSKKGDENKSAGTVITGPPPLPPPRIVHARPALYQFVILAIAAGGLSSLFQTLIQVRYYYWRKTSSLIDSLYLYLTLISVEIPITCMAHSILAKGWWRRRQ